MMVEPEGRPGESPGVPGPPAMELSPADRRRLERAVRDLEALEARAEEARRRFAALVRELGISPCARALGVSRQALRARVVRIERRER